MSVAHKHQTILHGAAPAGALRPDDRRAVRHEALMRAIAIVQRYQDENWRRLRVNDICADLKRLIRKETDA
jgi:hypothetical protein